VQTREPQPPAGSTGFNNFTDLSSIKQQKTSIAHFPL